MKMNLGCGFDVKDGWFNTNHFTHKPVDGAWYLDAREEHKDMIEQFDFILVNHVFMALNANDLKLVLTNIKKWLKKGGKIHIIDMDITMAIAMYQNGHDEFPVKDGSIDYNFLMHVSGFGTRLSLFTPKYMAELLVSYGFTNIHPIPASDDEYDTRKLESLRFEATK